MLRDYEGFFTKKIRHKGARASLLPMHMATFIACHRGVPVEM